MVYIILLNWKNAVDTIDCLKSLKITDIENKIIVCDNNSPDDSLDRIKDFIEKDDFYSKSFLDLSGSDNKNPKLCCKITLIATEKNLGFAGGNNVATKIALSQSDADYIWLLNNDTEVESNSLSEIIKRFRKIQRLEFVVLNWSILIKEIKYRGSAVALIHLHVQPNMSLG